MACIIALKLLLTTMRRCWRNEWARKDEVTINCVNPGRKLCCPSRRKIADPVIAITSDMWNATVRPILSVAKLD